MLHIHSSFKHLGLCVMVFGILLTVLSFLLYPSIIAFIDPLPSGQIVFSSQDPNQSYFERIYAISPDGTGYRRIGPEFNNDPVKNRITHVSDFDPAWSSDKKKIAFISRTFANQTNDTLCILDIETSQLQRLPLPGFTNSLTWSPDGNRIAFSSIDETSEQFHLYVLNIQTNQTTQVSLSIEAVGPQWSPDGNYLAFISNEGAGDYPWSVAVGNVFKVKPNGTQLTQLTYGQAIHDISWSPDSQRLALTLTEGQNDQTVYSLYTIGASGSNLEHVPTSQGFHPKSVAWSPNGRWLAVVGNEFELEPSEFEQQLITWCLRLHIPFSCQSGEQTKDGVSSIYLLHPDGSRQTMVIETTNGRGLRAVDWR